MGIRSVVERQKPCKSFFGNGLYKKSYKNLELRKFRIFARYFFGAMGCLLFFESFATFAAIAYGVIGGKTVSYCCLAYGLPALNVGVVSWCKLAKNSMLL